MTSTLTDISTEVQKINRGIFGERDEKTGEIISEGISGKVSKHEVMYQEYGFIKKLTYGAYTLIGIFGVDRLIALIKWVSAKF
jgi:hypothetical protein